MDEALPHSCPRCPHLGPNCLQPMMSWSAGAVHPPGRVNRGEGGERGLRFGKQPDPRARKPPEAPLTQGFPAPAPYRWFPGPQHWRCNSGGGKAEAQTTWFGVRVGAAASPQGSRGTCGPAGGKEANVHYHEIIKPRESPCRRPAPPSHHNLSWDLSQVLRLRWAALPPLFPPFPTAALGEERGQRTGGARASLSRHRHSLALSAGRANHP